jgi:hypothetical protein
VVKCFCLIIGISHGTTPLKKIPCIQITSLEVMNRYTSSGTYIVRPLNYYVGPLAVSNNRAKTTTKVNKTMNRVLGWSP